MKTTDHNIRRTATTQRCRSGVWLLASMLFLPLGLPSEATSPADWETLVGQPVPEDATCRWDRAEVLIEWGFQERTKALTFDGRLEVTQCGRVGRIRPLPGDARTALTGDATWTSPPGDGARRGIVVPVLLTDAVRGPARTILTVRTVAGSFSFQPIELRRGPLLVPDWGFFLCLLPSAKAEPPSAVARHPILPDADLLRERLEIAGKAVGWGKDTPVVYANASGEPLELLNGAIVVPPRTMVVHPGPDRDVALGWRSPFTGQVRLRAKVTDGHPTGGDGVSWTVVLATETGRDVLAGGAIDRGGSASIPAAGADAAKLSAVAVRAGEALLLSIGRRGEHSCDTTFVEFVLEETGGNGRSWDATKDVAADLAAANPHADSLGNAGVWHFLAPAAPGTPVAVQAPLPFRSQAPSAHQYLAELARHQPKTVRQRVREHPEQTWAKAMRALYGDAPLPAIPKPPFEPAMSVQVPDANLTALWRLGAWRIINRCPRIHRDDLPKVLAVGDVTKDCRLVPADDPQGLYVVRDHPFPPLGCESDRVLWALDHLGMHQVAADGMAVWLAGQRQDGALTLNSDIERAHQVGALQLLWVMTEHYRLTGDRAWLERELPRLKAAADWILERRKATMKRDLTPEETAGLRTGTFSPYGLQPKISMGDGDPTGSRYYYWTDSFGYRSVKLFADVAADVDPAIGARYAAEARKYLEDIQPVLDESMVLCPILRVQDGTGRSFHPQGFQDRGPLAHALPLTANIYSHCGPYHADYVITSAAIEAWLKAGVLSVDDPRLDSHFDVLEDVFLWDHPWFRKRKPDYAPARDWFDFGWAYQSGWERLPEYYLLKDDVPNFLRSWLNRCAVDLNLTDWTFNEHTTFAANDKSHGYAAFLSNFRNLLAIEIGDTLWLARGTPRAWLGQDHRIAIRNAPTYFGTLAYEIVSDVDHGQIQATLEWPSRKPPSSVVLRLRHPKATPIKSVTVNGQAWSAFSPDRETIELEGLSGMVRIVARY